MYKFWTSLSIPTTIVEPPPSHSAAHGGRLRQLLRSHGTTSAREALLHTLQQQPMRIAKLVLVVSVPAEKLQVPSPTSNDGY